MTPFLKQAHINVRVSMYAVLGSNMRDGAKAGQEITYLAAGCFWGVEKTLWSVPGVVTTAISYMGGYSTSPTYEQVYFRSTGHTETVRIVFNIVLTNAIDLVHPSFEIYDPTQMDRQDNDINGQYRSAIQTTMPKQLRDATALRTACQEVSTKHGSGLIQIIISPAPDTDSTARF